MILCKVDSLDFIMRVIVQYSIADCRHVQNTSGVLTNWYRIDQRLKQPFLRNSGRYDCRNGHVPGCYYNASRAIKINKWFSFVNEQAKKDINIQLAYRQISLNSVYATAIYEICFDISLSKQMDILYILDELSKLEIRIPKSFKMIGNDYLKKDFSDREYLTTLVKAKKQITNHYVSITTKKNTLLDCGADIYKNIKCFAPQFFVLIDKSEYIHFHKANSKVGSDGKEEIIILNRDDKKGINYQGYIFVNTDWISSDLNTYSCFNEALSIKLTLDEVLYQIIEGHICPSQKTDESDLLQRFLSNCINHFEKEVSFISEPKLKAMIYANPLVLNKDFNFENLKRQIKEVINIRPNYFKFVESYLKKNETMAEKQGNNITINNYSGTVSVGDNNNISIENNLRDFDSEVDKLLKRLQDDNDSRIDEVKADIEAMKVAFQNKDKKKAQERLEKIKTYGGLILDFAKIVAPSLLKLL